MARYEKVSDILVPCDCGCGIIRFSQWYNKDKPEEVNVTYYLNAWHKKLSFLDKLKLIFCIITGKEYLLYDVSLITKESILALKESVSKLNENIDQQ